MIKLVATVAYSKGFQTSLGFVVIVLAVGQRLAPVLSAKERAVIILAHVIRFVRFRVDLRLAVPVSEPGKPISFIHDIVVIEPDFRHSFYEVQAAPGPEEDLRLIMRILVPRLAVVGPDGLFDNGHGVIEEVVDCLGLGGEGENIFRLPAVAKFEHVVSLTFWRRVRLRLLCLVKLTLTNRPEVRAAGKGVVGSAEHEVVGADIGGRGHVRSRVLCPLVLDIDAVATHERESWHVGGVETSRTY